MRYFIHTLTQLADLEQLIKKGETDEVFQVVIRESNHIKRFTWHLLELDINFERKPLGSGITNFYIDINVSFFLPKKKEIIDQLEAGDHSKQ